ncbi:hypothetical protein [Chromobacterium amazonense]|uniref:hypothetical protein n=1 Tax=Chromobacterium amazonense TaxID=1382803 RepID=UPI003F7A6F13
MQKNITITFEGVQYVGFAFDALPLSAAKMAACQQIDAAADDARRAVLGDPLRAVEYQRAEAEAAAFKAAGYKDAMPPCVQSWADAAGLEPQVAADSILGEAAEWSQALHQLRAIRLKAKQQVLKAADHTATEAIATRAMDEIRAGIAGVGNA